MSVVKTIDIGCDWPECIEMGLSDGITVTPIEARAQLRKQGWGRRRIATGEMSDLCPRHLSAFEAARP